MAGRPTLWGAGEILRSVFSQATTPPPYFYLALITDVAPNPYISGDELNEPAGISYARAALPNDLSTWGDQNTGQLHMIYNLVDVSFATATEDWGTVGYWALCDSDQSGNVYFTGDFETPNYIAAGDQVVVPSSLLAIEFGPFFFDEEP